MATLSCANNNDKFSSTASYGNGLLTYPVGLITADEVALAGGKYNMKNEKYYLRTNAYFWTMTPSRFNSSSAGTSEFNVYPTGLLSNDNVASGLGLRPVINLKSETMLSRGNGTVDHPFEIN